MSDRPAATATNPFPAEAVATYGSALHTCATLRYMQTLEQHTGQYLKSYAADPPAAGASIALQGGYGAGKTHALSWIATLLADSRSFRCRSVYVKCDSSYFADIYRQALLNVARDDFIELIQLALLSMARDKVRAAKLTESVAERLEAPGALSTLDSENNIDLVQLRLELLDALTASTSASREAVRVLLDLPSPVHGQGAYDWMKGALPTEVLDLGVSQPVIATVGASTPDADQSAIAMLELVAALHRFAGVPFCLLVDQLEVLMAAPTAEDVARLGSSVKRFLEQLNLQGAFVAVAGTPKGWAKLPPDVAPRFRTREPIAVGRLSLDEVSALLEAYLAPPAVTDFAVEIHALSGGSPREVLRIAHHAFTLSEAGSRTLRPDEIIAAAEQSGSIADQSAIALAIVDETLGPLGSLNRDVQIEGVTLDRLLNDSSGVPRLAVIVVRATDALSEIDWYRRLAQLSTVLASRSPPIRSVAVLVGYSSLEAGELISLSDPVRFDEVNLGPILKGKAIEALASMSSREEADKRDAVDLPAVLERLNRLEQQRLDQQEAVHERFSSASAELYGPERAKGRAASRIQIEDLIDALARAATLEDEPAERRLLREILIANDLSLHDDALHQLGGLYRELINFPGYYRGIRLPKQEVLMSMQQSLTRPPSLSERLVRDWRYWASIAATVGLTILSAIYSELHFSTVPGLYRPRFLGVPAPYDLISSLPIVLLAVLAGLLGFAWAGYLGTTLSRSRTARLIASLRETAYRRSSEFDSIRDRFPQP